VLHEKEREREREREREGGRERERAKEKKERVKTRSVVFILAVDLFYRIRVKTQSDNVITCTISRDVD